MTCPAPSTRWLPDTAIERVAACAAIGGPTPESSGEVAASSATSPIRAALAIPASPNTRAVGFEFLQAVTLGIPPAKAERVRAAVREGWASRVDLATGAWALPGATAGSGAWRMALRLA